jgi:uncharacterized protein YegJ (DUF2314 family)
MGLRSWFKGLFAANPVPPARREDKPLIALVLFLDRPRDLDSSYLCGVASRALGVRFTDDEADATDQFVAGSEPSFIVKYGDHFFLINSFDRPYMDDPEEAAQSISELRLRKAVREHSAWLSVDLLGDYQPGDLATIYRTIGKLTAALADDDCLAIFAPATGQLNNFDEETREQLCGDDPLELFETSSHPPVVPVSGDDPRLRVAVAKARKKWPEFVAGFERRQPDQTFSVKARIGDEDTAEFMWVSVTGLEHGWIYGRLDNDPIELSSIRCGDRVRVQVEDLNDWLYTNGDEMIGGFTIEVLRRIQEELRNG